MSAAPPPAAFAWAELLLRRDPLCENAHRHLMHLNAETGRRADALPQYETCERRLREDLGVERVLETTLVVDGPTAVGSGRSTRCTTCSPPGRSPNPARASKTSLGSSVTPPSASPKTSTSHPTPTSTTASTKPPDEGALARWRSEGGRPTSSRRIGAREVRRGLSIFKQGAEIRREAACD
jgi:hypothetical protein